MMAGSIFILTRKFKHSQSNRPTFTIIIDRDGSYIYIRNMDWQVRGENHQK